MRRQTITVDELATLLGVSRNTAYTAVRNGDVPSLRVGARIVIPRRALEDLIGPIDLGNDETSDLSEATSEASTACEDEWRSHAQR